MFKRLRTLDVDAVAGVIAAVVALVLHVLGVADEGLLLAVALVVLAILMIRDLRREAQQDRLIEAVGRVDASVAVIEGRTAPVDAVLIGPRRLRPAAEEFAQRARGDMTWFNVCLLMFRPEELFDSLLKPAIDNPAVSSIQFVLDDSERERWATDVLPKVRECAGAAKVREPMWRKLDESVSFILTDTAPTGATEAHVSFWGEPFMARTTGGNVPRYVFHIQPGSELLPRLTELERSYRLAAAE